MKIFLTLCSLFSVCYGLEDASSCYVSEDDMSYKLSPFSSELSLQQTDWGSEGEFTDWGSDDRVSTPSDSSLHFGSYSPTEYGSSVDSFMADISENSVQDEGGKPLKRKPNTIIAKYMLQKMFEEKEMVARKPHCIKSGQHVVAVQMATESPSLIGGFIGVLLQNGALDVYSYNKLDFFERYDADFTFVWKHYLSVEHLVDSLVRRRRSPITAFKVLADKVITSAPQSDTCCYEFSYRRNSFELCKQWKQKRPLGQVEIMGKDFYFLGEDGILKRGTLENKKKIFCREGIEEIAVSKDQKSIALLSKDMTLRIFDKTDSEGLEKRYKMALDFSPSRYQEPYMTFFLNNILYIGALHYLIKDFNSEDQKEFSLHNLLYDTKLGKTKETATSDLEWAARRMLSSVVVPDKGPLCVVSDQEKTQVLLDADSGAAITINQFVPGEEIVGIDYEKELIFTKKGKDVYIRTFKPSELLLYQQIKMLDPQQFSVQDISQIKQWCLRLDKEKFFDSENELVSRLDTRLKHLLCKWLELVPDETRI